MTGGTRPGRMVIGTLGLDQHEVGAMAISQLLVRHGYEVIYLGRFNTPERLAAVARQEDADLIGVSVHSWEFTAYAGELLDRCRELGIGLVFGGSVLTEADRADLLARGAGAVFGPYASEDGMLAEIGAIIDRVRSGVVTEVSVVAEEARPLAGRVVVVTGAARGLGRAYTGELSRQGAAVLTTSAAGLYGLRAEAAYSAAKAAVAMLARVAADEMARYQVTVNAVAPAARTRLTSWLAEGPGEAELDPWAAEHVAPVVAWLLGPGARDVTGRVIEAANGQVSVPAPWQPGTTFPLPPLMSPAQARELLPRVLGGAGAPPGLLAADAALSGEAARPRPEPDPPRAW